MPTCPKCGHPNSSGKFCIKCGTRLQTSEGAVQVHSQSGTTEKKLTASTDTTRPIEQQPEKSAELLDGSSERSSSSRSSSTNRNLIIAGAAAVVMLLAVLLYQLLREPPHNNVEQSNNQRAAREVEPVPTQNTPPQSTLLSQPVPTPQAATENPEITEGQIRDLVNNYLQQTGNDFTEIMNLYGDRVDYYDKGIISRDFVLSDKREYFSRWPTRSYALTSPIETENATDAKRVSFEYRFEVRRGDASRRGRASCELVAKRIDGGLRIVLEKGKVLGRF